MIVDGIEYPDSCPICSKATQIDDGTDLHSGVWCSDRKCSFGMWKIFDTETANEFWFQDPSTTIIGEMTLDEFQRKLKLRSFE